MQHCRNLIVPQDWLRSEHDILDPITFHHELFISLGIKYPGYCDFKESCATMGLEPTTSISGINLTINYFKRNIHNTDILYGIDQCDYFMKKYNITMIALKMKSHFCIFFIPLLKQTDMFSKICFNLFIIIRDFFVRQFVLKRNSF